MGKTWKYERLDAPKEVDIPVAADSGLPTVVPGPLDYFRLKRKNSGWIVEGVSVVNGTVLRCWEVWDWDRYPAAEKRLVVMAKAAEALL